MYKIRVNNKFNFEVIPGKEQTLVNGEPVSLDIHHISHNLFHILYQNRSFNAELIKVNKFDKTCIVRINSNNYTMSVTDKFDELLHKLGMDNSSVLKVSDLKAPMPGLVLRIMVGVGDEVKKGTNLLVLEAMKMENIIKSPADVIIKSIKVNPTDKVEKNQVMIVFT
jgi:biotin carboxyl carrier protein